MNTQPDAVIEHNYETAAAPRQSEATVRTAPAASRRDFIDDPRRKSPALAFVLSLMPGVGQIYVGYYQLGFTHAIIVASIIALLDSNNLRAAEPLLGVFLAFFWLYNVVDAWRRAEFYNNALAGIGPAKLPDEFAAPSGRGTLAGGAALVIVGLIALSNTVFGLPLDWLEHWWPVALIAVGAWLIYPSFAANKKKDDAAA
jgi:hypothetical protein